eukprot:31534-Pelagococcus_subviridis.AAC.18
MSFSSVAATPLSGALRVVPYKATSGWSSKASVGVERRRGVSGLKAWGGRRDAPGKVLKDRRSPRLRGRMGASRSRGDGVHRRVDGVLRDVRHLVRDGLDALVRPPLLFLYRRGDRLDRLLVDADRLREVAEPLDVLSEEHVLIVLAAFAAPAGGDRALRPRALVLRVPLAAAFAARDTLDVVLLRRYEYRAAALAREPEMPGVIVPVVGIESELSELPALLARQPLAAGHRPVRPHDEGHVAVHRVRARRVARPRPRFDDGVVEHAAVVRKRLHRISGAVVVVLAHPHLRAAAFAPAAAAENAAAAAAAAAAREGRQVPALVARGVLLRARARHERVGHRILLVDEALFFSRHLDGDGDGRDDDDDGAARRGEGARPVRAPRASLREARPRVIRAREGRVSTTCGGE